MDPIAGQIYENVQANISESLLIPQYVFKTEARKISLASSFMGVVNWVGASGSLQFESQKERLNSANAGAGDMIAVPLTVGIHFSENNNLAISTWFFPPTGQFTKDHLSNLGMGVWTIMPNVAHTLMWKKRRMEFDTFVGFDIYSHNQITNYTSGTVFHWETMAIHHVSDKVGFGAIGANVTQITNDLNVNIRRKKRRVKPEDLGIMPIGRFTLDHQWDGTSAMSFLEQHAPNRRASNEALEPAGHIGVGGDIGVWPKRVVGQDCRSAGSGGPGCYRSSGDGIRVLAHRGI